MKGDAPCVLCCGLAAQDHVFLVDHIPDRPEKFRARDFAAAGGGTGATAAVAVARLGGRVWLLSQLGSDPIGDAIVRDLEADGVDCSLVHRLPGCRSSVSAVIVDRDGERLVLNYADPTLERPLDWVPSLPADIDAVMADARWPRLSYQIMVEARARGLPVILDADTPGASLELVAVATVVAFSAPGLRGTTGASAIPDGLARAAQMGDGLMMATDGANGVFWREGGRLRHVPAFAVAAIDTLGAGDVFHGALALAVAEGLDVEPAVVFASGAAALKTTRFGGRTGAPHRADLDAFLAGNPATRQS